MTIRQVGIEFLHSAGLLPGCGFVPKFFFASFCKLPVIFRENTGYHSLPTGIIARLKKGVFV